MEEFNLAEEYGTRYLKLSIYDRIALAIAKHRGITLLTGDGALRKAARAEGVHVLGTIGIEFLSSDIKSQYRKKLLSLK